MLLVAFYYFIKILNRVFGNLLYSSLLIFFELIFIVEVLLSFLYLIFYILFIAPF